MFTLCVFVQLLSHAQLFATPWTSACQAYLSFTISQSLRMYAQIHVHLVSDAIQPSHLLLFPSTPAFYLSPNQGLSQWVSSSHLWPTYWNFSISPSNEYSGSIFFRTDWFDLLAVQGFSRIFSNTTFQKHQFFSAQPSLWSNSHIHTWLLEKS